MTKHAELAEMETKLEADREMRSQGTGVRGTGIREQEAKMKT
jgi:hypothetical protein